jgi:hypothetical protein
MMLMSGEGACRMRAQDGIWYGDSHFDVDQQFIAVSDSHRGFLDQPRFGHMFDLGQLVPPEVSADDRRPIEAPRQQLARHPHRRSRPVRMCLDIGPDARPWTSDTIDLGDRRTWAIQLGHTSR